MTGELPLVGRVAKQPRLAARGCHGAPHVVSLCTHRIEERETARVGRARKAQPVQGSLARGHERAQRGTHARDKAPALLAARDACHNLFDEQFRREVK